jgi:hypothetical protein
MNRDAEREERIVNEIIVDCYGPEEEAAGWYTYLEEQLQFPFEAVCVAERAISPLQTGEKVTIIDMAPQDECDHEMFVMIRWQQRSFAAPLMQFAPAAKTGAQTVEAVEDWRYWLARGNRL